MQYKGIYFIFILLSLGIFLIFISFAFPEIIEKTNEPSFCIKCHVMKPEYFNQIKGGLHNNLKCVECHLPYDYKVHFYAKKIYDGVKDTIVFYTGLIPERIFASTKSKDIIQENCIRCHIQIVSKINIGERKCWDCHRKTSHQLTGLIETLK